MHIRDAVEADLPAIVAIYNATVPSRIVTADLEPVSVESRQAWFHSHTPKHRPLWVVEVEQETHSVIAGWLGFQSFYGRPAYESTTELSIYIAPGFQRQGFGRILLKQAIAQSPALGIKTLLGFIFAENSPSLKLFELFGFQQWGYLPRIARFDQVERDLVILGLRVETSYSKPELNLEN